MVVGQRLFHAHGYDAVGLALLTDTLGIKPPSFYKAFGSKAEFFNRILDRYAASVLSLDELLTPDRNPVDALSGLLKSAARAYCADPEARGCLVLEAVRGNDTGDSAPLARRVAERRRNQIRQFVAATHPDRADTVTDFISSTLSGLSAAAREGMGEDRLIAIALAAASALPPLLSDIMQQPDQRAGT